jgi:hypothetical protein
LHARAGRYLSTARDESLRCRQIAAHQGTGKMAKRPLIQADFLKRRALMLPKEARYDEILKRPKGSNLGTTLVEAMNAVERDFEPLPLPSCHHGCVRWLLREPRSGRSLSSRRRWRLRAG